MASMFNRRSFIQLGGIVALFFAGVAGANADTLTQITSSSAQNANDSLAWSQKGADGTVLAATFPVTTGTANSATVSLGAANSMISVVCTANPCSWTGTGFTAGHSLLWSSDAGNGGSGPVTLIFTNGVSGVGALIQADMPGQFTGEIQVYNGSTLLATYTTTSDTEGDPVYLGALDQSGANINKVVFNLTACAALCTDFGLDTVNVNTTSAGPAVTLTPTSLTFASTATGSTTAAQVVTIKNSGTATLNLTSETITGSDAASFIKSATTCGATLAAAATCTVSVEFSPTSTGALSSSLSIADNAGTSPQAVSLSGSGTSGSSPVVSLSPSSLTFASQNVGSTSTAQSVTLSNSGHAPLSITSIAASGDFAETNTCGTSVAAGANCQIAVTFTPTATGSRAGAVTITDNGTGSPQMIAVSGTGAAPPASAVTLSPTSLTFAAQTTGSSSAAQSVTLTNSGGAALAITSIAASGDFTQTNTCGTSVAPAGTCTILVTFAPTAAGNRTGAVSIADNATGSPQSIPLTGAGSSVTISSSNSGGITISSGASGTATLQVGSADGFSGTVGLTCTVAYLGTGQPKDPPTCSLNPAQEQLSSGATANAMLTVNTTGASAMLLKPLGGGTALAGLVFLVLLPRRRWRGLTLILVLGLAAAIGLSACGGSGGIGGLGGGASGQNSGTTPGSYTVTVTATSGMDTATATIPLTVN
jgi:hypothetical protein